MLRNQRMERIVDLSGKFALHGPVANNSKHNERYIRTFDFDTFEGRVFTEGDREWRRALRNVCVDRSAHLPSVSQPYKCSELFELFVHAKIRTSVVSCIAGVLGQTGIHRFQHSMLAILRQFHDW